VSARGKAAGALVLAGVGVWVANQPVPASQADQKSAAERAHRGGARTVCPVPGARLTSGWGPRDDDFHDGIDLAAPLGTPIHAVIAGTVTFSAKADPAGYGQFINITGSDGMQQYGHMRTRLVHEGDIVTAGQVIARVGEEGQATGPHLHLRIYPTDVHTRGVDPARWLAARGIQLPC
jgi:murein DD-endopeptidase MepM/ murein hydrolase activator NlpD